MSPSLSSPSRCPLLRIRSPPRHWQPPGPCSGLHPAQPQEGCRQPGANEAVGTPGSRPARAGPRVTPAGPRWGHREPACVLRVSSRPGRPPARRPLLFGGRHVARCPEAVADWPCDPGHRPGAREPQGARPQHMVATLSPASRSTVRTRSAVRQAGTVRRVRAGDTAAAQTPTGKEAGRSPCARGDRPLTLPAGARFARVGRLV